MRGFPSARQCAVAVVVALAGLGSVAAEEDWPPLCGDLKSCPPGSIEIDDPYLSGDGCSLKSCMIIGPDPTSGQQCDASTAPMGCSCDGADKSPIGGGENSEICDPLPPGG